MNSLHSITTTNTTTNTATNTTTNTTTNTAINTTNNINTNNTTININKKLNKLNSKWVVWYHNPSDNNWDLKSYKNVFEFNNLEDYFKFLNTWENNLPELKLSMFFIMRKIDEYEYIYPMWEDKNNKMGGCWSFKVDSNRINDLWKVLTFYLIGENIGNNIENSIKINGMSFSPKKGFCIIKIWNNSKEFDKNNFNKELHKYINIDSCLYKSHLENISKDLKKREKFNRKKRNTYWNR